MPKCGSQIILCDLPIRFDTYKGCSHACSYCFVNRNSNISMVGHGESPKALEEFIKGKRDKNTSWCDWDIPIHWGGMSDPFQPAELTEKRSLDALKVFHKYNYPFVVSTKSILFLQEPYKTLMEESKCVLQVSMVCDKYDRFENGCPSFEDRLSAIGKIRPLRKIIRVQPFVPEVEADVIVNLARFRDAGVYGVVLEGMKYRIAKPGLVKFYGDMVYPKDKLKSIFMRIKEKAHEYGLVFYCGENRLRSLGDNLTCCGIDGLEGFIPNTYNFNSFNCGRKCAATDGQKTIGTASAFITMLPGMEHKYGLMLKKLSFEEEMKIYYGEHKDIIG